MPFNLQDTKNTKRLYLKLIIPVITTLALFIHAIFFIQLPQTKESLINQKKQTIRNLVLSASHVVENYYEKEQKKEMTREQAQNAAKNALRKMRYGPEGKDYFWINDLEPKMIMHPYRTDLDGVNVADYADAKGKYLFIEFVKTVKQSKAGYVSYMWQWKDDENKIVPKMSYVKIFEPWEWIVGTGIYLQDVETEAQKLIKKQLQMTLSILLIDLLLISFTIWHIRKAILIIQNSEENLRITLNSIGDALISTNEKAEITNMNPVAERLTGWTNSEAIGKPLDEVFIIYHSKTKEPAENPAKKVLREGKIIELANHITLKSKTGHEYSIADSGAPIRDKKDNITGVVLVFRDVTTQKKIETELDEYRAHLEDLIEERTKSLKESEKRFKDISYSIADWVWEIDIDGNVTFSSDGIKDILGYSSEEIIGMNCFDLIPEKGSEQDRQKIQNIVSEKSNIVDLILWNTHKNNKRVCMQINGVPIIGKEGELLGYRGVNKDITEKQVMEERLKNIKQRLEAITANLAEGIIVIDGEGIINFYNPAALRILQTEETIYNKSADDVFCIEKENEKLPFVESPLKRVVETKDIHVNNDCFISTQDNKRINIAFSCSPLMEEDNTAGAVISFRDISKAKESERENLQSMKLASIGQLASGIAHEINTPTQFVGDNITFLEDAFSDIQTLLKQVETFRDIDMQKKCIDIANEILGKADEIDIEFLSEEMPMATKQAMEGVERISKIVAAMRDFSAGSNEKSNLDINNAIHSTLLVSKNEWKAFADVETSFEDKLPLISCYAGQINQVMLNLMVNAAHAIEETGHFGKITISTKKIDDFIEIKISDTGAGIPDKVKDKIFDPFFTTKKVGKGTGQGMTIVHSIIEKHEGQISFESEKGKGTTFTVRLPIC